MLIPTKSDSLQSAENWSGTTLDATSKLFKIQHFLLMAGGKTFNIEVQESCVNATSNFVAYADNNSDPHDAIHSCHGKSLAECLQSMVLQLEQREKRLHKNSP